MWVFLRALLLLLATALWGCRARGEDGSRLRLALSPRLTHAPALTAIDSGRLQAALGPVRLESHELSHGNAIVEALFAGELDAAYLGPNPAINAFVRSRGALRIVAGSTNGGSLLVVRRGVGIERAAHLAGKRLATPGLASTQDVALRSYLRAHALDVKERGGSVAVLPMSGATLELALRRGEIDGAWVPEPLGSQLIAGANVQLLHDERDSWPGGRHPTTVLVARTRYFEQHPEVIARLLRAHAAEVQWLTRHPSEGLDLAVRGLERRLGRRPPDEVCAAAWERLSFTLDPQPVALTQLARDAALAGYLPAQSPLAGLVSPLPLDLAPALARAQP